MSLATFLQGRKAVLESGDPVTVVMGNEAADLDSCVAALAYSYFLSVTAPSPSSASPLPLINIPREDMSLRPEVVWLLRDHLGLDPDLLLFSEDIDLLQLKQQQRLSGLVLVDHNRLAATQEFLYPEVVKVLDHHVDENMYPESAQTTIELVGSCCSLVAREVLASAPALLDPADRVDAPTLALLLRAAILIDTAALDPAQGKAKPLDIEMEAVLRGIICGTEGAGEFQGSEDSLYASLAERRFDISGLATRDLLRKDYKQWDMVTSDSDSEAWTVGISSVAMDVRIAAKNDNNFAEECARWSSERQLDLLLIMGAYFDEAKEFRRQLAIVPVAGPDDFSSEIAEFLMSKGVPLLPEDLTNRPTRALFYEHTNVKQSRKQIQPFMVDFFNSNNVSKL